MRTVHNSVVFVSVYSPVLSVHPPTNNDIFKKSFQYLGERMNYEIGFFKEVICFVKIYVYVKYYNFLFNTFQ